MASLIDALTAFNRRERHILVGWVLDRSTFPMGHEFRDALSREIEIPVPADSFVAMDYNLNWLLGALLWSQRMVDVDEPQPSAKHAGIDLKDNSDSDVIVAFARGPKSHVVLVEAKGYTGWDGTQFKRKCARLGTIFGKTADRFPDVVPHWVFVSPKPLSNKELLSHMHPWMLRSDGDEPHHLALPQPASHKFALGLCDSDGKSGDKGHWKIGADKWPGP